ncbi:kinase-like domain-containing protein [Hypoxylon argillaceum]|nr:kinase-like domain-containing protein [Hypoxylon argillaceum]
MEFVTSSEVWKGEKEDLAFDHVGVILRQGSRYYFARQDDRHASIKVENLTPEEIPHTYMYAPFPAGLTQVPDPLPANIYLKRANLLDYHPEIHKDGVSGCDVLLEEAKIYETLRLHPHKNIARYYGCLVEEGNFHALCLEKYPATLKDRQGDLSVAEKTRIMQEIRDAVAHLHSLGLVHNDLKPNNIMITDDGTAILIDFDSCRPAGELMGVKGSTPGWEMVTDYALPENDLQLLDMIERSLLGDSATETVHPNTLSQD